MKKAIKPITFSTVSAIWTWFRQSGQAAFLYCQNNIVCRKPQQRLWAIHFQTACYSTGRLSFKPEFSAVWIFQTAFMSNQPYQPQGGLGYLKTKDVAAVRFIIFIKNQTANFNCVTCGCEMYRWFYGLLENIILNDVIWICLEIFKWISIKQITADAVYWIDQYIWCWRRLAVMLGYENADNQL